MLEGKLPPDDFVLMESLSAEYGWTPDQIRGLSILDVRAYNEIRIIKARIRNSEQRRQKHG